MNVKNNKCLIIAKEFCDDPSHHKREGVKIIRKPTVWCVDGTPGETVAPKSLTDRGGEAMDQTVGTHTPAVTVRNEGRQGEQ